MSRINELKDRILDADFCYWHMNAPVMSDEEYDLLVEELRSLEPDAPALISLCPLNVQSSGKVRHPRPMLSCNKVYDYGKLLDWAMKYAAPHPLIVMPKYDGVALAVYSGGTVATRGDGTEGECVTEASCFFISRYSPGYGEAVIRLSAFEEHFEPLGYKTPRNAIAGILNAKDPEIREKAAYAEFVRYDHITMEVPYNPNREEYSAQLQMAAGYVTGLASDYPLDGVVFRIADETAFNLLGHTDHHWRGQIALKFRNASTESVIEEIRWQEKNGTVTPVAVLAPVTLGGVEIFQATLHNANRVREWDIRVGDRCKVERAGGVIPKIVQTWRGEGPSSEPVAIPEHCPSCGLSLGYAGARLYCMRCDK